MLGDRDRLEVLFWMLGKGPATQAEIRTWLEVTRRKPVNPAVVSRAVKPLVERGVLTRASPRGPVSIRDPERLTRLLQMAAALSSDQARHASALADADVDELRRALISPAPHGRTAD